MIIKTIPQNIESFMIMLEPLMIQFFISQALAHLLHAYFRKQKQSLLVKILVGVMLVLAQVVIMLYPTFLGDIVAFDISTIIILIAYGFFGLLYGRITFITTFLFILFRYIFFKDFFGSPLYFIQLVPMLSAAIMAANVRKIVAGQKGPVNSLIIFFIMAMANSLVNLLYLLVWDEVRANILEVLGIVLIFLPILALLDTLIMFQQRHQITTSEKLIASEALQRASINAPKEMEIFVLDRDFNYMSFNDFHARNLKLFFGGEAKIGANFLSQISNSQVRLRLEKSISRALNGENYDQEVPQGINKGKYLHDFYAPLYDKDGHIIGTTIFSYEITERKQREETITYLSYHDILTGLYNRRFYDDYVAGLNDYNDEVILVYADINSLKVMNDLFGHEVGDELIIVVASKIKEAFRNFGIVARTGGDEIIIVIKNAELVFIDSIIEDLKEHLKTLTVQDIQVSVSIGRAVAQNGKEINQAMLYAEDLMYKDKAHDMSKHRSSILNVLLEKIQVLRTSNVNDEEVIATALKIGKALELTSGELAYLKEVARLREIGNVVLPHDEFIKTIEVNEEDIELMHRKLEIAYRLILGTDDYNVIANDVVAHHENYDGTGLPRGLKGEEIPLKARIIKIAVAYCTYLSKKSGERLISKEEALKAIKAESGTHYDPHLVNIFIENN